MYVDGVGDGMAPEDATLSTTYATIKAALDALGTDTSYATVTVKLSADSDIAAGTEIGYGNIASSIIIESADGSNKSALKLQGVVSIANNITFNNVKLAVKGTKDTSTSAHTERFEIAENVTLTYGTGVETGWYVNTADNNTLTQAASQANQINASPNILVAKTGQTDAKAVNVILNSGYCKEIVIGGHDKNTKVGKTSITIDGDNVKIGNIVLANRTPNETTHSTVTADVDIYLKRGALTKFTAARDQVITDNVSTDQAITVYENGAAICILQYNGFTLAENAAPTEHIYGKNPVIRPEKQNIPFYRILVPSYLNEVIRLSADTVGAVFSVSEDVTATRAYDVAGAAATGSATSADDGTLRLTDTGIYKLTYAPKDSLTYYVGGDAANDNNNTGLTENSPLATVGAAITAATAKAQNYASVGKLEIVLLGDTQMLASTIQAAFPIVIKSNATGTDTDPKPKMRMTGDIQVKSALTLDNFQLESWNAGKDVAAKYTFHIVDTVIETTESFETYSAPKSGGATYNYPQIATHTSASTGRSTLILNGGTFSELVVGHYNAPSSNVSLKGADITLGGTVTVTRLYIGSRNGWSADGLTTTFISPINITQNGGSIAYGILVTDYKNETTSSPTYGHYRQVAFSDEGRLQLIFNGVSVKDFNTSTSGQTDGGVSKEKLTPHSTIIANPSKEYSVAPTQTVGQFALTGASFALATADAEGKSVVVAQGGVLTGLEQGATYTLAYNATVKDLPSYAQNGLTVDSSTKLFVGWKNKGTKTLLKSTDTLDAASNIEPAYTSGKFSYEGAQVRNKDGSEITETTGSVELDGLRFVSALDKSLTAGLTRNSGTGALQPGEFRLYYLITLGDSLDDAAALLTTDTQVNTGYNLVNKACPVLMMQGTKDTQYRYCVRVVGDSITTSSETGYVARAYFTYSDHTGTEYTVYAADQSLTETNAEVSPSYVWGQTKELIGSETAT